MAREALLLVNRHSRRGRDELGAVRDRLFAGGIRAEEHACPKSGQLSALIAEQGVGKDLVIVGGGDGTLNAALEGLVETGLPLGVLPLGTANDFARTLGLPADPLEAAEVIIAGHARRVDLGQVNGKHFLNVASMGLSVKVARALSGEVKRRWGRIGYGLAALRALREAPPFLARIRCDGRSLTVEALQVAVGNGRHFGGGMTVAQDARIDDCFLDMWTLEPCGLLPLARLLPRLKRGTHDALDLVHSDRAHEVEVVADRRLAVNTDGEITTATPARFRVRPRALTVLVPEG